jgi:hypothetical protein
MVLRKRCVRASMWRVGCCRQAARKLQILLGWSFLSLSPPRLHQPETNHTPPPPTHTHFFPPTHSPSKYLAEHEGDVLVGHGNLVHAITRRARPPVATAAPSSSAAIAILGAIAIAIPAIPRPGARAGAPGPVIILVGHVLCGFVGACTQIYWFLTHFTG